MSPGAIRTPCAAIFSSSAWVKCSPAVGAGGGAVDFGVHGLVPLAVLQLLPDIGRQRHLAQVLQNLQENSGIMEANQSIAALPGPARPSPSRRRRQRRGPSPPSSSGPALSGTPKGRRLYPAAAEPRLRRRRAPGAPAAGLADAGIVDDQAVARGEIITKVCKVPVLQLHQSGGPGIASERRPAAPAASGR